jgi:hypothetical protein
LNGFQGTYALALRSGNRAILRMEGWMDVEPLYRGIKVGVICAQSATTGYILASGHIVFKTTDAGATYHVLTVPRQG